MINEAMASCLPVLSSKNVGAAEELVIEGETGFLFNPMYVNEITLAMEKIHAMSEDQRLAMGEAARNLVEIKAPKLAFGEGLKKLLLQQ